MICHLLSILDDSTSGFKEQIISALCILKYEQYLLQTSITDKRQYRHMYYLNLVNILVANCEPLARWVYFMTASYVLIVPVKNHAEKIYIW